MILSPCFLPSKTWCTFFKPSLHPFIFPSLCAISVTLWILYLTRPHPHTCYASCRRPIPALALSLYHLLCGTDFTVHLFELYSNIIHSVFLVPNIVSMCFFFTPSQLHRPLQQPTDREEATEIDTNWVNHLIMAFISPSC